eukprot:3364370-Rhodomonas_salina.1
MRENCRTASSSSPFFGSIGPFRTGLTAYPAVQWFRVRGCSRSSADCRANRHCGTKTGAAQQEEESKESHTSELSGKHNFGSAKCSSSEGCDLVGRGILLHRRRIRT